MEEASSHCPFQCQTPNGKAVNTNIKYFGVKWPRNRNRVYRVIETVSVTDARVTQTLLEPVTDH